MSHLASALLHRWGDHCFPGAIGQTNQNFQEQSRWDPFHDGMTDNVDPDYGAGVFPESLIFDSIQSPHSTCPHQEGEEQGGCPKGH